MPLVLTEFAYMRKVTTKVDVFSFGILVMEFLTKQRPTGLEEEDGCPVSLSQLIEKALSNGTNGILQVLDPVIARNVSKEEETLVELFKLALSCTNPNPDDRPNMDEVLSSLKKLSNVKNDSKLVNLN